MVAHGDYGVGIPDTYDDFVGNEKSDTRTSVQSEAMVCRAFIAWNITKLVLLIMEHVNIGRQADFQEEFPVNVVLQHERDLDIMNGQAVIIGIVDAGPFKGSFLDIPQFGFPFPLAVKFVAYVAAGCKAYLVKAGVGIAIYLAGAHACEESAFEGLGVCCD